MADSRTYPIPDPAAVAAKVAAMGGPQLDPSKPVGTASGEGVTVGWSIANGQITICLLHKSMFIPESTVWSHIDQLFAA